MSNLESETQVTSGLLGLELYIIETSPARSERTRDVLPEHIAHQIRLEREGILFCAGPVFAEGNDIPTAGMIVIRASNFDEAKRIADSDPFHAKGIREYTIRKWILNEGAMNSKIYLSDQRVEFT